MYRKPDLAANEVLHMAICQARADCSVHIFEPRVTPKITTSSHLFMYGVMVYSVRAFI